MSKYVVRGRKLRHHLQSKGFECKVDIDIKNPRYDVFLFEDSLSLRKEITNFTEKLNKEK